MTSNGSIVRRNETHLFAPCSKLRSQLGRISKNRLMIKANADPGNMVDTIGSKKH